MAGGGGGFVYIFFSSHDMINAQRQSSSRKELYSIPSRPLSSRAFCSPPESIQPLLQWDRQTLRTTDDTDHGRYGPLRRPAEKWDRHTGHLHRGAYPSTAAVPPRCLASLVAVTDTYDGYERCSLTDLMDMYIHACQIIVTNTTQYW